MKRILSILICVLLIFSVTGVAAFAEGDALKSEITVTVTSVSGNPGDIVFVPVSATFENGISNAAFWISYNKSVLKYQNAHPDTFGDYTVYDRSKDGRIGIVLIAGDEGEKQFGNLICLEFKISEKAKAGSDNIKLNKTFFQNGKGETVEPEIINGEIKIAEPCTEEHQYIGWVPAVSEKCKENGISSRYCTVCGHSENKIIAAPGHKLEKNFTVDTVAENGKPGMLSRHCTVCGAKTNIIVYTEKNTAALSINNIAEQLEDTAVSNLVYFLNGGKIYPDIYGDDFDPDDYITNTKPLRNGDGTINIDVLTDKLLHRLFGDNKKGGFIGAIKRAAMADVIPIKSLCWLIRLILV